jgi:hypothetical protein
MAVSSLGFILASHISEERTGGEGRAGEGRGGERRGGEEGCWLHLYLEPCLAPSSCSINICGMNGILYEGI